MRTSKKITLPIEAMVLFPRPLRYMMLCAMEPQTLLSDRQAVVLCRSCISAITEQDESILSYDRRSTEPNRFNKFIKCCLCEADGDLVAFSLSAFNASLFGVRKGTCGREVSE